MTVPRTAQSGEASDFLLDVNDLVVHFEAGRKGAFQAPSFVHAVDGVSFRVRRGTTFGIVGESGSGKSTTAQAVMRLVPVTSGQIVFRDRNIADLSGEPLREVRRHLQIVFQDPFSALNPRRRAGDQIREPLDLLRIGSSRERDERVRRLLAEVGLPPQAAGPVSSPILWRPAAAALHRPRARAGARFDRLRRGGIRA